MFLHVCSRIFVPSLSATNLGSVNFVRLLSLSGHQWLQNEESFKFRDVSVELSQNRKPKPDPNKLVFGHHFSDHMLSVEWNSISGWNKPAITPVRNFSLHPGAKCLHYAIELFEGMKAYRGVDDKIRLFRPHLNMERMNFSAARSCLPTFDGVELTKCIKRLIDIDQEWVPHSTSSTLYIRPTIIGTEPTLGVTSSTSALLYVLIGPVGPYFPTGFKPVSLLADPQYIRAAPGGSGAYKLGSNYAPTVYIQKEAAKRGFQQVLWLYGEDHQLTEVGTMNIFMYWTNQNGEKELVTPPLDQGIILPGVTRRSLLELAKSWGEFKVTEHIITMKEVLDGLQENRVHEIFGSGTACVVCPVEKIHFKDIDHHIPTVDNGAPITTRLHKELTDIQFGRVPSDWVSEISAI